MAAEDRGLAASRWGRVDAPLDALLASPGPWPWLADPCRGAESARL
jgi:hypothetical protein